MSAFDSPPCGTSIPSHASTPKASSSPIDSDMTQNNSVANAPIYSHNRWVDLLMNITSLPNIDALLDFILANIDCIDRFPALNGLVTRLFRAKSREAQKTILNLRPLSRLLYYAIRFGDQCTPPIDDKDRYLAVHQVEIVSNKISKSIHGLLNHMSITLHDALGADKSSILDLIYKFNEPLSNTITSLCLDVIINIQDGVVPSEFSMYPLKFAMCHFAHQYHMNSPNECPAINVLFDFEKYFKLTFEKRPEHACFHRLNGSAPTFLFYYKKDCAYSSFATLEELMFR